MAKVGSVLFEVVVVAVAAVAVVVAVPATIVAAVMTIGSGVLIGGFVAAVAVAIVVLMEA